MFFSELQPHPNLHSPIRRKEPFGKRVFQKSPSSLEILESPDCGKRRIIRDLLEILEIVEILEILQTAEALRNNSGPIFREMILTSAPKSKLPFFSS